MAQRALPYEYEIEENKAGLTSVGGLPTYLDLAALTGLLGSIGRHLRIRTGDQGWTDRQMI
ncbi:MAG: IS1380 family transposase, partial [Acidobacteriota bacterium]